VLTRKERGKIVLVQAMKVHSGNRGIAPLIINHGDRLSGKLQEPVCTVLRREKVLPLPGIEPWSVHPTA
jgi:hypothetical protein